MHHCYVLYTLVLFFFFGDIACKVVACCAGPECCFCLHLFVLIWRLLFTCVNIKVFRTDGFFRLPFTDTNAVPLLLFLFVLLQGDA